MPELTESHAHFLLLSNFFEKNRNVPLRVKALWTDATKKELLADPGLAPECHVFRLTGEQNLVRGRLRGQTSVYPHQLAELRLGVNDLVWQHVIGTPRACVLDFGVIGLKVCRL